jgi:hypothetical protein
MIQNKFTLEDRMVRNIKILTVIASTITTFFIAASANAAVALPNGWYAEANVGDSRVKISSPPSSSVSNSGFGWNANLGYKFTPYFAGEVGYTKYSDADIKLSGTKIARDTLYSYQIVGKAILPVSDTGLEVFAKIGAARVNTHMVNTNPSVGTVSNPGTTKTTSLYYGLGAQYSLLPNVPINVQWNRAQGKSSSAKNLDLISAGVAYIFN